jgi:hypothetical protein
MRVTRDGALLWLLTIAALAGYLTSVGTPPTEWTYAQWLQFAAAAAAWGIGKLQASPAPSSKELRRGFRDNGAPV